MKTNTIKYVGFYDTSYHLEENRNTFLAATNKMDYIASAIAKLGYSVDIISPSWSGSSSGYYKRRKEEIMPGVRLIMGSSFGAKSRILRFFRIFWSWISLFFYLCFNIKRNEKLLVYHSMMLITPVVLAQKVKKFKLILEVEEIYQDVSEFSIKMKRNEYIFFKRADGYIFPTELLNKKLNVENRPNVIIHGTYHVEKDRKCNFDDEKIHVVYAGTFDPRKGGAIAAIHAAAYLPKRYHVHIIGFGSEKDKSIVLKNIDDTSKIAEAVITYDGLLNGEKYICFLQKCDIGLSTQKPGGTYNETSFPSKILSYMSNGLRVVSIRIQVVEISAIGQEVYYYDEPTPEAIADAITSININKAYNSRQLIQKLDEDFAKNIKGLLEGKYE